MDQRINGQVKFFPCITPAEKGEKAFLKCLISIKHVQPISLAGGVLIPPCPTPGRYPAGRVDRDSVIFQKNEATVPLIVWGRPNGEGISHWNVAMKSAAKEE